MCFSIIGDGWFCWDLWLDFTDARAVAWTFEAKRPMIFLTYEHLITIFNGFVGKITIVNGFIKQLTGWPCDRIWFVPDVLCQETGRAAASWTSWTLEERWGRDDEPSTMAPCFCCTVAPWQCQERAKRKEDLRRRCRHHAVQNSPLASKRLVWSTSEISKFTFEQARFYMWYRLPLISTAFFVSFFHCHHWLDQWCSSGSETQARRTADHWGGETLHGVFPSQWMVCFRENPHL